MINNELLLKKVILPYSSEKVSFMIEKNNSVVLKVSKDFTKKEIKSVIYKVFKLKVSKVRTLIVKGKSKNYKNRIGYRKDWKKAYIFFKGKHNIDSIFKRK